MSSRVLWALSVGLLFVRVAWSSDFPYDTELWDPDDAWEQGAEDEWEPEDVEEGAWEGAHEAGEEEDDDDWDSLEQRYQGFGGGELGGRFLGETRGGADESLEVPTEGEWVQLPPDEEVEEVDEEDASMRNQRGGAQERRRRERHLAKGHAKPKKPKPKDCLSLMGKAPCIAKGQQGTCKWCEFGGATGACFYTGDDVFGAVCSAGAKPKPKKPKPKKKVKKKEPKNQVKKRVPHRHPHVPGSQGTSVNLGDHKVWPATPPCCCTVV